MVFETISQFYQTHYRVKYRNCLEQSWKNGEEWGCFGEPKQEHLFLLYLQGGAEYTTKKGEKFKAAAGELVYTPKGSEYSIRFCNEYGEKTATIAVRFGLFDENGADILLSREAVRLAANESFPLLMGEIKSLSFVTPQIPVKYDCALYTLISELGDIENAGRSSQKEYRYIQAGLEYITRHFNENASVESLAARCHISAVYFRKLFKRYTGKSPVQYRTELRLKRAREYLLYGNQPVNEIAEILGYDSPAYFIKQFKEGYGCSPYAYRLKQGR